MTDSTHETERVTSPSAHWGRWVLLGGIATFLVIVAAVAWFQWPVDPLPPADQIATMHVRLDRQMAEFEVPANHVSYIRSALSPTRIDQQPPDCKGMGGLRIRTKKGHEVGVALYSSDYNVDGTYYHYPSGGYDAAGEAIEAARTDASHELP